MSVRSCECCGSIVDDGKLVIEIGDLVLNREFQTVAYQQQPIRLTSQQFGVLELLAMRSGRLVPRYAFFIAVLDEECEDKQVDVIVCRIRDKFRKVDPAFDRISTLWGRGYTWLRPNQERL